MWLMDTHTLKLNYFTSPEAVEEGYAILSHVWDKHEQSFQDLQEVLAWCERSGDDARDFVTKKTRRFCELAELHGYKWAWMDTCCIDKTSSAELEEAINAMFRFYSQSKICYAYLDDAVDDMPDRVRKSALDPNYHMNDDLGLARWHKRGWTLQELIAPREVHFLTSDWDYMGCKTDLAKGLERITGVPASILTFEQRLDQISIARRMSWAAKRNTTRVEDQAYCLMGIFGVNMITLYGEGTRAFERLQQEIMRRSPDTTLFAWGYRCDLGSFAAQPEELVSGLFASSPSDFRSCSAIIQRRYSAPNMSFSRSKTEPHRAQSINVTMFTVTPHRAIFSRIPVITINGQLFADLSWFEGDVHLLLILRRSTVKIESHRLYTIGLRDMNSAAPIRIARVPPDSIGRTSLLRRTWVSLYLSHLIQSGRQIQRIYLPMNHGFPPFLRIDEFILGKFLGDLAVMNVEVVNAQLPWLGSPPLVVTFLYHTHDDLVYAALQVGVCKEVNPASTRGLRSEFIWANVRGNADPMFRGDHGHECPEDHVLTWPLLEKMFTMDTYAQGPGELSRKITWKFTLTFAESEYLSLTMINADFDPVFWRAHNQDT
ncbi:heterokaryon incompatibility protein-domain-containing protein [Earliella scabrosa]|nr:heterokaryon incompatibility protein-domain-containing protein [Earliella scabrosa]